MRVPPWSTLVKILKASIARRGSNVPVMVFITNLLLHYNTCKTNKGINDFMIWALTRENLSSEFVNNKGADQPVHLHRLISAFVIRLLESMISILASSKISIF